MICVGANRIKVFASNGATERSTRVLICGFFKTSRSNRRFDSKMFHYLPLVMTRDGANELRIESDTFRDRSTTATFSY